MRTANRRSPSALAVLASLLVIAPGLGCYGRVKEHKGPSHTPVAALASYAEILHVRPRQAIGSFHRHPYAQDSVTATAEVAVGLAVSEVVGRRMLVADLVQSGLLGDGEEERLVIDVYTDNDLRAVEAAVRRGQARPAALPRRSAPGFTSYEVKFDPPPRPAGKIPHMHDVLQSPTVVTKNRVLWQVDPLLMFDAQPAYPLYRQANAATRRLRLQTDLSELRMHVLRGRFTTIDEVNQELLFLYSGRGKGTPVSGAEKEKS